MSKKSDLQATKIKTAKINVYIQDEREKFWHDESARKSITEKNSWNDGVCFMKHTFQDVG